MDTITLPVVTADASLKDVWDVMHERKCANVLVSKGQSYVSLSDKDIANAIVRNRARIKSLINKGKPIKVLSPSVFATASKQIYHSEELGRLHRSIERAHSPFVGHAKRPVLVPNEFANRLQKVLRRSHMDLAIVGINFDTATVFSRSERNMYMAQINHGGPGRYQCDCSKEHLWEPDRLNEMKCPLDGCGVAFIR